MNSHTFIDIGKGMYRVTVRSKLKRNHPALHKFACKKVFDRITG